MATSNLLILTFSIRCVHTLSLTPDVPFDIHAPMPRKEIINGIFFLEQSVSEIPNNVITRYGLFYGPGTWYDYNGFRAEEIRHKRISATEGVTSFILVEDAANAAFFALDWASGPVNIVDGDPNKGADWLPVYADAIGSPPPDIQSGRNAWERGASNDKARKSYGWEPKYPIWRTGFAESLKPLLR